MSKRSPYFDAVDRFLAFLQDQKHASRETIRAYENDLAQFGAFLSDEHVSGPAPGPEGIDVLAVRGFVAHLSRRGLGKSSIARKLSAVRSFLKHAAREGRIESSPAARVPTPRVPKKLPRELTVDEVFNLLDRQEVVLLHLQMAFGPTANRLPNPCGSSAGRGLMPTPFAKLWTLRQLSRKQGRLGTPRDSRDLHGPRRRPGHGGFLRRPQCRTARSGRRRKNVAMGHSPEYWWGTPARHLPDGR